MVVILCCSRAPAIRFATDLTRPTSLERLASCLDDLGGVTREVLTDRDHAFCIGQTSDGAPILAPDRPGPAPAADPGRRLRRPGSALD